MSFFLRRYSVLQSDRRVYPKNYKIEHAQQLRRAGRSTNLDKQKDRGEGGRMKATELCLYAKHLGGART